MSTGKNIKGALSYNEQKVRQGTAELILASRFGRDINDIGFSEKVLRFEKLNQMNPKSKTNTLHLSLNFSQEDQLSDEKLQLIAFDYMERIGFGAQPFLVYKHSDTSHPHLHIVTTTIKPDGKAIYLHNLAKRKSEPARKAMEKEYDLVKAEGRKLSTSIKSSNTISNTVSRIVSEYKYTSLEELNSILRQYNIVADPGEPGSFLSKKGGLVYCRIDENGYKTGKAVKASSIYKNPTLKVLQMHFERNAFSKPFFKKKVQGAVVDILHRASNTAEFLEMLEKGNIGCSIRYGSGRNITDVGFVHKDTKTIFRIEELGMSIPDFLNKLNYQPTLPATAIKHKRTLEPSKWNLDNQSSNYSLHLIKTLFSTDQSQPDISPEFIKKKRKKKKR